MRKPKKKYLKDELQYLRALLYEGHLKKDISKSYYVAVDYYIRKMMKDWQDAERTFLENERVLSVALDCTIGRPAAA